ncbi:MAG: RNA polymerase factor sigma-54 [Gammaproteobacteria bacterium]|jgi:RNA polymerase sigma-54 factor
MKQSLQLRLGQHLTMTPQLQQAIRLLQLSTLDLKQEIQDALDSNIMLETEEEGSLKDQPAETAQQRNDSEQAQQAGNDSNNESEINAESADMPEDLPVDSSWEDTYEPPTPMGSSQGSGNTDSDGMDFLAQQSQSQSLQDYLVWQMNLSNFSDTDLLIASSIIDGINDDGYLTTDLEDIVRIVDDEDVEIEEVEAVLHRIQFFDPPGVGARDTRECLLAQLLQLPEDTDFRSQAITLVKDLFQQLVDQNLKNLKRRLGVNDSELQQVMQLIRSLNPRPGTSVVVSKTDYVEPDVFVRKISGKWQVTLNGHATPKLRVNAEYASFIRRADDSSDNVSLKNHLQEARWFIKSLESRNETLMKVATKIVDFQHEFFEHGDEAMKPLVLRDIAEELDMHESTISRVTTQKYMHTPRGTFEFKYFFSSHVSTSAGGECSATAIRALIKKLIAAETPAKPLSDNKIAQILVEQGIEVARRTVAKYREAMGIPPSNERKRLL